MAHGGECGGRATRFPQQRRVVRWGALRHAFSAVDYWRRRGSAGGGLAAQSKSGGGAGRKRGGPLYRRGGARRARSGRTGAASRRVASVIAGASAEGDVLFWCSLRGAGSSVTVSVSSAARWTFLPFPPAVGTSAACAAQCFGGAADPSRCMVDGNRDSNCFPGAYGKTCTEKDMRRPRN